MNQYSAQGAGGGPYMNQNGPFAAPPQPHWNYANNEPENRKVKRNLRWWHIFLIVISGTIGMGLFENSGSILAIAGPGGGITAYVVVGVFVIAIMEGLAEMITHWPISNAMVEFVSVFLDKELAIVIGVGYAYAYSISFTTLIITAADLTTYWNWAEIGREFLFIVGAPFVFVLINCLGVLWYGNVEAFAGVVKVLLVLVAFFAMCAVNHLVIPPNTSPGAYVSQGFQYNPSVATSCVFATLVAFPIATYAYLGVEIVAVTAVEALNPETSLRGPARHIAWITALMYSASVFAYYFNVEWDDPYLPAYLDHPRIPLTYPHTHPDRTLPNNTASIVIIAAENAGNSVLSGVLNALLILAVLSAANTALYVSSRTIWGLACRLDSNLLYSKNHFWWCLSLLSTTTPVTRVPGFAILLAGSAFWVLLPILLIAKTTSATNVAGVMSGAATIAVVIVWASQCLAFIRYRTWIHKYHMHMTGGYLQFDHWKISTESLRYASNFSSYTGRLPAFIGLTFCVIMVCVFASASWWVGGTSPIDVAAAFGGPGLLLFFWLALKVWRWYRNDDFKWWETINAWEELREKLDGLTNAIHKRDLAYPPANSYPMQDGMPTPIQTPLVDGGEASANAQYPGSAAADALSYPLTYNPAGPSPYPTTHRPQHPQNSITQTQTGSMLVDDDHERGAGEKHHLQHPPPLPHNQNQLEINVPPNPPQGTARTTGFNSPTSPQYPSYTDEQQGPRQRFAEEPFDPNTQPPPPHTRELSSLPYQGTTPWPEGTTPFSPPRRRLVAQSSQSGGGGGPSQSRGGAFQPPPL